MGVRTGTEFNAKKCRKASPIHTACVVMVLLAGLMLSCIWLLSGCGSGNMTGVAPGTVTGETDKEITIVDQAGREVTVPKGEKESIAVSYRVVVRFLLGLDVGDKITGMGKADDFFVMVEPSLSDAVDVGKGVPDLEALAELSPDIFFHKATDVDGLNNVQELGIPAIGLSLEDADEMMTAMSILGKVLDREDKADQLERYYEDRIKEDEKAAAKVADKRTALVMGATLGTVADGSMLQGHMIEYAGGVNVAADLSATELWPTAGTEQIFDWDPEYIFITGGGVATYMPEDIYGDPAWSQLRAVKDRHVYVIPTEQDSWELPGVVTTLGIDFMRSKMYPEQMSTKKLRENVEAFYNLTYGKTFTEKDLGW